MWQRMQTENRFGDDAECSQRPSHQLLQVITGNIFHDLAAALRDSPVAEDDGGANNQVAHSAVAESQSAAVIGSDDAAHGCMLRPENIKRQMLSMLGERALKFGKC